MLAMIGVFYVSKCLEIKWLAHFTFFGELMINYSWEVEGKSNVWKPTKHCENRESGGILSRRDAACVT